jgi:hypothetical protein
MKKERTATNGLFNGVKPVFALLGCVFDVHSAFANGRSAALLDLLHLSSEMLPFRSALNLILMLSQMPVDR